MHKESIAVMALLTLMVSGCATSDDGAAVARAAVNTGLVAASIAGYGSPTNINCELQSSEYERSVCIKRNDEINAARANINQPLPKTSFEVEDSSASSVVKFGVAR